MKTDKKQRVPARGLRGYLRCLCVALAIALSACDGGIIGTSAGPTNPIPTPPPNPYMLRHLPERISPDLPDDLIRGEERTPEQSDIMESDIYPMPRQDANDEAIKARGWEELTLQIDLMFRNRIFVQGSATLIDLAFDDIQQACSEQLADCIIPKDQIRVRLTQDVIDRLIILYNELVTIASYTDEAREFALAEFRRVFTSLLDTEVVFDETRYSQGGDVPYEHSVQTTFKRQAFQGELLGFVGWDGEKFDARWNDDGQLVKYETSSNAYTLEYFYENGEPGEVAVALLSLPLEQETSDGIYFKIVGDDPDKEGILVDTALAVSLPGAGSGNTDESPNTPDGGGSPDAESVDQPASTQSDSVPAGSDSDTDSSVAYSLVRGRLDNRGGYTSFRSLGNENEAFSLFYRLFRESFDSIGTLLAGESCVWGFPYVPYEDCGGGNLVAYGPEGGALTDSVHYFEPGGFDTLLATQDSIRWAVQGLPVSIQNIAVVTADNALPLSEREFLCRGVQFVEEDVRIFCTATDEQLENVVVVERVDGRTGAVIPEASLEQIQ